MFELLPVVIPAGVLLLALVIWGFFAGHVAEANWQERWPAISDDEFVAKCSPGTTPETALKARRIIAEQLGVPYERVSPEQRFVEDLLAD
ncbi:hypothetical protein [Alienimonas chondri]|uniref:Carrier domain-containing protein n=1 Tax=Alienimonas chondri TaxID=2681879 RepID=A0ABX1VHJ3_9PLAN|nr:hypothetical protein [Alienimonas chondri]NNJ26960.1 hypothetical protein [Alienimonas chondri]